jgi:glutamate N-acetyltransferase/amino-acid N-acetyltransferase
MSHLLTTPKGFLVAAIKSGIKASGKLDLGLIVADVKCNAAGVFSTNKIVSPTVTVTKKHISSGYARAIYVNAGNANSCTGKRGYNDALKTAQHVATLCDIKTEDVLICSTGIIGEFMPMNKVLTGVDKAFSQLGSTRKTHKDFMHAILTTDLVKKEASVSLKLSGKQVTISGVCKGSGMIAPNMATMLGFITTDANISTPLLRKALRSGVESTINKVSVDNHSSTNDSVLVLASGLAGNKKIVALSSSDYKKFANGIWQVCDTLAQQLAADGEGATCMIKVIVKGAKSTSDARRAVRAIVDSPLVRCAFNGGDPNWGRIISAVGYSEVTFIESKLSCKICKDVVYKNGKPVPFNARLLAKKMKQKQWEVEVYLGAGKQSDFCYTCDLSKQYVTINADYHT